MSNTGRHRPFWDNAGYRRHCWECVHSKEWNGERGRCELGNIRVDKYDSPNNPCCRLTAVCDYKEVE